MTQQRIWLVFAVIAGIGFGVQVSLPTDLTDWPETTFDTAPRGHAGVFSLLDRFEATPGRWLSGVTKPASKDTIWWIAPSGVCESASEGESLEVPPEKSDATAETTETGERGESGEQDESDESSALSDSKDSNESGPSRDLAALPSAFEITARPWIEAGGTAVVWLPHPPLPERPSSPEALEAEESVGDEKRVDGDPSEVEASQAEGELTEDDALAVRENWAEDLARERREIREGVARDCETILGIALPPRKLAGLEAGLPAAEGRNSPIVFSVGRATKRREDFDYGRTRILPGSTLAFFQSAQAPVKDVDVRSEAGDEGQGGELGPDASWRPLWVEADEAVPLALERKVGEGRLIVIADARILSNDRLGHVDSAPFIFDFVRDYGRPWIDEHAHGVVPETGTFRYLAQSPAWAAGLGLLVLGLLVVWRGNAWPTRSVSEFDPDSPTLSTFVDSVARLYSGTRDHAQVFDRYRLLCLDRIRRAVGLSPGTEVEVILASLRARAGNWPQLEAAGLRHLLVRQPSISNPSDLARNVARLDELVHVLRDHGKRNGTGSDPTGSTQLQRSSKGNS